MSEAYVKLLSLLNESPKYSATIFIASTIALFPPAFLANTLPLEIARPYLGAIWLVSLSWISVSIVWFTFPKAIRWLQKCVEISNGKRKLKKLTDKEKGFLQIYIKTGLKVHPRRDSNYLYASQATIQNLLESKIINLVPTLSPYHHLYYRIQDWAFNYLQKRPRLLKTQSKQSRRP